MADNERKLATDRKSVQFLLQTGLTFATLLMTVGVVIKGLSGQFDVPAVSLFELGRTDLSLGDRLMAIGILVLAATPAFRVVALLLLWFRERDWRFVIVSAIVMATLALAIALGGG